jgi:hypothetical protein
MELWKRALSEKSGAGPIKPPLTRTFTRSRPSSGYRKSSRRYKNFDNCPFDIDLSGNGGESEEQETNGHGGGGGDVCFP